MSWWKEKPNPALAVDTYEATSTATATDKYAARTAELEAELAAIPIPLELYRILKDFKTGSFNVKVWRKLIYNQVTYVSWRDELSGEIPYNRSVISGWTDLCVGLPSHRAALGWLRAYLDPTTNRTSYDKDGRLLGDADA